jgi:hypothetical protein
MSGVFVRFSAAHFTTSLSVSSINSAKSYSLTANGMHYKGKAFPKPSGKKSMFNDFQELFAYWNHVCRWSDLHNIFNPLCANTLTCFLLRVPSGK